MKTWWTLHPHDPLIARDGRPFEAGTGPARTLDMPPPSVIAGTLRTAIGWAASKEPGKFGLKSEQAREIACAGPLLAEQGENGEPGAVFLPAPRDLVLFEHAGQPTILDRHRLSPAAPPLGLRSDLPATLLPVSGVDLPDSKPARAAPAFWSLREFERWCLEPAVRSELPLSGTLPALDRETRTHLAIRADTLTAQQGMLFQTEGLRFRSKASPHEPVRELALLVGCDEPRLSRDSLLPMGGERRLSALRSCTSPRLPAAPRAGARRYRVILLTPAFFDQGAVPDRIGASTVRAAAVGRPLALSGWDIVEKGPKKVRRAAPAGSVYWVELDPDVDPAAWIRDTHLQHVSSQPQDRRDGFGLVALGVWP